MQVNILDIHGKSVGKEKLPSQFEEEVRKDRIQRAVLAIESIRRQAYGAEEDSGMRPSAKLSRRRRNYKGSYGKGISRVPRKTLSHSGSSFYWVAAVAPGTVGGRRAHPPKSSKVWEQKINKKERKKAIRSALSATMKKELVIERGHIAPENYPFIVSDEIEDLNKTREVLKVLKSLGLEEEMKRNSKVRIRAGRGKSRGRRFVRNRGILIVVSKECPLIKAAENLPLDVKRVDEINAEDLAPGGVPGR
ncbi:MAG: 50S ribosomal protein L4, partial [Candidatus Micrarchaeia archaeon]